MYIPRPCVKEAFHDISESFAGAVVNVRFQTVNWYAGFLLAFLTIRSRVRGFFRAFDQHRAEQAGSVVGTFSCADPGLFYYK